MLTKETVIDKIEILEDGTIQIRRALRVFDDDGSLIGQQYHREVLIPTTPLASVPAGRLRQHAQVEWTPAVIAAYQAAHP